jgi:hypothetical protein
MNGIFCSKKMRWNSINPSCSTLQQEHHVVPVIMDEVVKESYQDSLEFLFQEEHGTWPGRTAADWFLNRCLRVPNSS